MYGWKFSNSRTVNVYLMTLTHSKEPTCKIIFESTEKNWLGEVIYRLCIVYNIRFMSESEFILNNQIDCSHNVIEFNCRNTQWNDTMIRRNSRRSQTCLNIIARAALKKFYFGIIWSCF